MAELPKATDLYGTSSPVEAAQKHEAYLGELNEAIAKGVRGETVAPGMAAKPNPVAAIESIVSNPALTKSMTPEALSSLTTALDSQRADLVKDINLTSPISTGLVAFDLEAPAKLIAPRPTPLRNKIVRKKGQGTSHRIKVIDGYTGTGTGGVGNIFPGITDTSTATFGSTTTYNRGAKIAYDGYDRLFTYKQFSLSDNVPFSAQFQGQGYQDIRQLAQTTTLYASMLMEERMLLMSRSTDNGSGQASGALAAPTVTLAAAAAGAGQTGLGLGSVTLYVYATSDAGAFGESVLSTVQSQAVTNGQVLTISVNNVAGALGTNIYVGTSTGAANAHYVGRISGLTGTLQGATSLVTTGDNLVYNTTGKLASTVTADTSAYSTGYDGIIPTIFGVGTNPGGFVNEINSTFSNSNPGVEFQNVFAGLYNSVKADPDEILMNGADRKQLSDAIKGAANSNYRLQIHQDEIGGMVLGDVVTGLQNEVTGKGISITVHPWLPQGIAPVLSYTLPIPDSQVSEVWAVVNTQDYMGIEWPVVDFNYSNSTYWNGTFVCYAPTFNGIVSGIVSA